MSKPNRLKDTRWLANRLGLSVSTVERLRAQASPDIPKALIIGAVIRYDALFVEHFILKKSDPDLAPFSEWAAINQGRYSFEEGDK